MKIKKIIQIASFLFFQIINAQEKSITFDSELLKLITEYKQELSLGNQTKVDELKYEIKEIVNHAYPEKVSEIEKILSQSVLSKQNEEKSILKFNNNTTSAEKSENNVITFLYKNRAYCAVKPNTDKFNGLYEYNGTEPRFWEYKKGEPIVELNGDQTGRFQSHGVPALKIKWWLESDCNGKISIIDGELAKRYTLVIKFEEAGENNYPSIGSYDMMYLDVYYEDGKMIILGEREKTQPKN